MFKGFTGLNPRNQAFKQFKCPILNVLTEGDLNDFVLGFNLPKKHAKLSGFKLKGWNLLHQDTEMCFFCNHQNEFKEFSLSLSLSKKMVFCIDVSSVTDTLVHQHDPTQWHLSTFQKLAQKLCF